LIDKTASSPERRRRGYLFKHLDAKPLREFHNPLLVAGWTKVPSLAGEGQKILVVAVPAFHAGKAVDVL
jgi:hypothetical protein